MLIKKLKLNKIIKILFSEYYKKLLIFYMLNSKLFQSNIIFVFKY